MIALVRAHRRAALYSVLALAIPFPAFALTGEDGGETGADPVALSVEATLDGCGLAESRIVCTIDVSYGTVAAATSYSASVTAPNGSVTDHGEIDPGQATLTVPYAGNGTYSVRITAYGDPPGQDDSEVIESASSNAGGSNARVSARAHRGAGEPTVASVESAAPADDPASAGGEVATAQDEECEPAEETEPAPGEDPAVEEAQPAEVKAGEGDDAAAPDATDEPPRDCAPAS